MFCKDRGCPAETRKVLQNMGFCPAKKYYIGWQVCTPFPVIHMPMYCRYLHAGPSCVTLFDIQRSLLKWLVPYFILAV